MTDIDTFNIEGLSHQEISIILATLPIYTKHAFRNLPPAKQRVKIFEELREAVRNIKEC